MDHNRCNNSVRIVGISAFFLICIVIAIGLFVVSCGIGSKAKSRVNDVDRATVIETTSETTARITVKTQTSTIATTATVTQTEAQTSAAEEAPVQETEMTTEHDHSNEVTPEFKELMDSYEALFDECIAMMNGDDTLGNMFGMLEYIVKIEDMLNELYEIDEDELSEADLAYYLEVIGRINTKLLKVSYS